MSNYKFKFKDIARMIEHWLYGEPNAYVGVTYRRNLGQLLLGPMDEMKANTLKIWMTQDMPILSKLSDDDFQVGELNQGKDTKIFSIKIGDIYIPITTKEGGA